MYLVGHARVSKFRSERHMHGMALIESLVSLLVLALGVMSLAGVQFRLLAENRLSNQRAVAIGLIDDMANRILNNKDAALAGAYSKAWTEEGDKSDCVARLCSAAQLAQADKYIWKNNISALLAGGKASIFISPNDSRQIGISIAWPVNEGLAKDVDPVAYSAPFNLTMANSGIDCPVEYVCHVAYVQP